MSKQKITMFFCLMIMYVCIYRFKQRLLWIPIPSSSLSPIVFAVPLKISPPPTLPKTARSGRPALIVTWTAPQSDRPITKYQVQYRRSGTTSWSTKDVTSTSTTLENLPAGTGYQVRVRAVSDVGTGPYSDVRTIITYRGMYCIMFHHLLVSFML